MAAGASFGSVLGSIGAFGVMLYYAVKLRRSEEQVALYKTNEAKLPLLGIYKDIFKLSIPIVLSSITVPVVNFIDTSFIVPLLSGQIGMAEATCALAIFGSRAQSIAGIPPVLSIALSTSLIPIISAAYARRDEEHLKQPGDARDAHFDINGNTDCTCSRCLSLFCERTDLQQS